MPVIQQSADFVPAELTDQAVTQEIRDPMLVMAASDPQEMADYPVVWMVD